MKKILIIAILAAIAAAAVFVGCENPIMIRYLDRLERDLERRRNPPCDECIWGEWETIVEATCTAAGEKTRTCTHGNCTQTETRPIDPWHDFSVIVSTMATCTEAGATFFGCSRCEADVGEWRIGDALGHDFTTDNWTTTTFATCIAHKIETKTCFRCPALNVNETRQISGMLFGHPAITWVRTGFYPYQETTGDCAICGTITFKGGTGAYTNAVGMQMVRIPAGTSTMGSPANEPGRPPDFLGPEWEETQRQVTLSSGFYMSSHQVTRAQWHSVMGTLPWGGAVVDADNRAATHVSWYDALVFSNRLSIQAGFSPAYEIECESNNEWTTDPGRWGSVPTSSDARWNAVRVVAGATGYRLPTEAQWEYAARAGTLTAFNDGVTNDFTDTAAVRLLGWFSGATPSGLQPVGELRPNAWGLHDKHGNVWEWVWDWFGIYPSAAQIDPTGPVSGTGRVVRGGSWDGSASFLRSAQRDTVNPAIRSSRGFRLVRP